MLKAILHGKAGRIEQNTDESVSWSSLFKAREDLLTSTVFERFAYLSDAVQACLLGHWFKSHHGKPTDVFGEFKGITYWPRFSLHQASLSNQVEPDSIFHFDLCNIIVEVKPPTGGDQYLVQWQREIESFIQSEQGQGKDLYFLAIGRIKPADASKWAKPLLDKFESLKSIAALEWSVVTEQLVELINEESAGFNLNLSKQDRFILFDMLEGLSLYGLQISPFKWAELKSHSLYNLSLHHDVLEGNFVELVAGEPQPFTMKSLWAHSLKTIELHSVPSYFKNILKD
ncbi:hypothetical protein L2703_11945 [Shewanella basaltis]|uniref:hypothetical protein n=1 Tax=Shewanella TaxID=22 RepID=UPI00200FFA83|nr:hypothetical protein [Shewanella basaltis]MCL1114297.1 hypothetical protein [Shewanella basaltis]